MLCDQLKGEEQLRAYVANGYHYFLKIYPDVAKAYDALYMLAKNETQSVNKEDLKALYSCCSDLVKQNKFDEFAKTFGQNFLSLIGEISKNGSSKFTESQEYKKLDELLSGISVSVNPRHLVKWRLS